MINAMPTVDRTLAPDSTPVPSAQAGAGAAGRPSGRLAAFGAGRASKSGTPQRITRQLAASGAALVVAVAGGAAAQSAQGAPYSRASLSEVSISCAGWSGDLVQAADPGDGDVYQEWEGCNAPEGIGFARSSDGGASYMSSTTLPGSEGGWDPSVAVAPDGTVYAAFMTIRDSRSLPVVAISHDHGQTFTTETYVKPSQIGNWGDADYIAVGRDGTVYLTWDYGPSGTLVNLRSDAAGGAYPTAGDLNVVLQVSTNGGRSFGPMSKISPGFPDGGADSAPLVIEPSGRIDVLYQAYEVSNSRSLALGPGYNYFTSSSDGGRTWSAPVRIGGAAGTMSSSEWWMDGSIAIDSEGDLYATWDTQRSTSGSSEDVGWLSYSTNGGHSWSEPIRATAVGSSGPHIMEATGGSAGLAYVAWLSEAAAGGYAAHLRSFSATLGGWLTEPQRISEELGAPPLAAADTFGLSTLSPATVLLSWDSNAVPGAKSAAIFAAAIPAGAAGEPAAAWAHAARHRLWRDRRLRHHRLLRHERHHRAHRRARDHSVRERASGPMSWWAGA
jgi:hypothetical protein